MPDSVRGELQGREDREPDSIRGMLGGLHRAGTVLIKSEQYRTEMQQLRIAARGLAEPIAAGDLDDPVANPKLPSEQAGSAGGGVQGRDEEDDS